MARALDTFERVQIESAAQWRAWLEANHRQSASVWVVSFKKHCGARSVSYEAIVDEALAFGWIDSLPRKLDADRTMLLLAPRRPGSAWSRVNKERVARLERAGRMHPAGRAVVDRAKGDGTWTFLDDVENLIQPEDLTRAFTRHPGSAERFAAFPRSSQRGILEWIKQAKRPATRAARIEETARLAALNVRANHPKR